MSPAPGAVGRWNYGFRTTVYAGVVGVLVWGAWRVNGTLAERAQQLEQAHERIAGLEQDVAARDRTIAEQQQQIAELEQRVQELELALKLLKVDHRLAKLTVLEQRAAPDSVTPRTPAGVETDVEFQELAEDGAPLGEPRRFTLLGKVAYVDALVIKFDDSYVEQGDALRGSSLCLFRRLFGEYQWPSEGFPLDTAGARPLPYAAGDDPGFESRLWTRFWDYANDEAAAAAAGVRAIHGEAPYIELREGRSYELELRASGGLSLRAE
jgi:hypothetical protein